MVLTLSYEMKYFIQLKVALKDQHCVIPSEEVVGRWTSRSTQTACVVGLALVLHFSYQTLVYVLWPRSLCMQAWYVR